MFGVFNMVVHTHPDFLDIHVLIRVHWQGTKHRLVQHLKLAVTTARQFLEGFVVELYQQFFNPYIETGQAEEGFVAQLGQYPAFYQKHAIFRF